MVPLQPPRSTQRRSRRCPRRACRRMPWCAPRSGSGGTWPSAKSSCARRARATVRPPPSRLARVRHRRKAPVADPAAGNRPDIVRYTDRYKTADARPATLDAKDYAPRELQPQALFDAYYHPEAAKKRPATTKGARPWRASLSAHGETDAGALICSRQEGPQEGEPRQHPLGRRRVRRRGASRATSQPWPP